MNIWDAHRIIPPIVYVCLLNWHDMSGGDSGAFVWGGGRGVWWCMYGGDGVDNQASTLLLYTYVGYCETEEKRMHSLYQGHLDY